MADAFDDKNFGADAELSSLTIDWGKPGDHIVGTYVRSRTGIETQFGQNSIYELLAERGSYHKLTGKGRAAKPAEKPTTINKGEIWSVWGRGDVFDSQMSTIKPGQIIKITFVEEKEGKNGTWKLVKIFAPKGNDGKPLMNEEWLKE